MRDAEGSNNSPFTMGNGNPNKKFVGPLKNPPFIPGPVRGKRSVPFSSKGKIPSRQNTQTQGGAGNFNDNVILDPSQVEKDIGSYRRAAQRRFNTLAYNNKKLGKDY